MNICKQCNGEFPNWVTVDGQRKNLSKRSNCLSCSPFKVIMDIPAEIPAPQLITSAPKIPPRLNHDKLKYEETHLKIELNVDGTLNYIETDKVIISYLPSLSNPWMRKPKPQDGIQKIKAIKSSVPNIVTPKKVLTKEQLDILDDYDNKLYEYDILSTGEYPGDRPIFD